VTTLSLPGEIQDLCQALLSGLEAILGEKLFALYLYGAITFPESGAIGDVDFHAVLRERLSDAEKAEIQTLHAALARHFPPLGAELDGYYILLEEALQPSPPRHQLIAGVVDNSWALHRAHMRAGRCIVLFGPQPEQVLPVATWPELEAALQGELDFVERHLCDYPDYCVLNLCRLMYSYQTRDVVVSKSHSAYWAEAAYPKWYSLIDAARRSYARHASLQDKEVLLTGVRDFFAFACQRIQDNISQVN
jgi:hypothetical protein